jgi:hypothetical protein
MDLVVGFAAFLVLLTTVAVALVGPWMLAVVYYLG